MINKNLQKIVDKIEQKSISEGMFTKQVIRLAILEGVKLAQRKTGLKDKAMTYPLPQAEWDKARLEQQNKFKKLISELDD